MIQILFENDRVVAVDKPHAWLTTPAREVTDPRPVLGRELEKQLGLRLFPTHRLDFEVSGIVLFAKDADAHRATQGWFEHGTIQKTYEALSAPLGAAMDWTDWHSVLAKGKKRAFEAPHGKPTLTRARVLRPGHWELQPVTGRPHQLRFEMSKHGVPILGDKLYGGPEWQGEGKIALRAIELEFPADQSLGLPRRLSVTQGLV